MQGGKSGKTMCVRAAIAMLFFFVFLDLPLCTPGGDIMHDLDWLLKIITENKIKIVNVLLVTSICKVLFSLLKPA